MPHAEGELFYSSDDKGAGKGDSYWKPSFLGSMLNSWGGGYLFWIFMAEQGPLAAQSEKNRLYSRYSIVPNVARKTSAQKQLFLLKIPWMIMSHLQSHGVLFLVEILCINFNHFSRSTWFLHSLFLLRDFLSVFLNMFLHHMDFSCIRIDAGVLGVPIFFRWSPRWCWGPTQKMKPSWRI